jgi:hypothetical protein
MDKVMNNTEDLAKQSENIFKLGSRHHYVLLLNTGFKQWSLLHRHSDINISIGKEKSRAAWFESCKTSLKT